jgi:hypothetical protein
MQASYSSAWSNKVGTPPNSGLVDVMKNISSSVSAAAAAALALPNQSRGEQTISGAHFFAGTLNERVSQLDSSSYKVARSKMSQVRDRYACEWKAQLLNPQAEVSSSALTSTLRPVVQALLELGPGGVNLSSLPVESVNGVHLAVVLRATLKRKDFTPGWDDALRVARAALAREGIDETKVLSGLIPKG